MSTSNIIRQQIWTKLKDVAKPDTRFDMNFAEVIPDFVGSEVATDRIMEMQECKDAEFLFITPDNCLVDLRRRLIEALLQRLDRGDARGLRRQRLELVHEPRHRLAAGRPPVR